MRYKSDILEVIHQSAIDKFEIGAISESRMKEYDEMCLVKTHEPVYATEQNASIKKFTPVTA